MITILQTKMHSFYHNFLLVYILRNMLLGIFFAILANIPSVQSFGEEYYSREQAIKLFLADADSVIHQRLILSEAILAEIKKEAPAWSDRLYEMYVGYKDLQPAQYLVIDNAIGKTLPYTYALVVGKDFKIKQIEVMAYRESHGGEIRNLPFRKQFYGKGPTDALRLNQDIANIGGATLSCRTLVDGVRHHVKILKIVSTLIPTLNPPAKTAVPMPPPASGQGKKAAIGKVRQRGEIELVRRSTVLMDTLFEIQVAHDSASSPKEIITAAIEDVIARIEEIENNISTWQQGSPASRFNSWPANIQFDGGEDLWNLISLSKNIWRQTEGSFDIATAPLSQDWRLGEKKGQVPTEKRLTHLRSQSTMSDVIIGVKPFVKKLDAGLKIDFGGIAKGFALDQARDILQKVGIQNFLMNFGGQISAAGNQPGLNQGWLVFINDPRKNLASSHYHFYSDEHVAKIFLKNQSLSVSADDQRGRNISGKLYSHIISPRDGKALNDKKMVAVIHDNAVEADAFSTGVFAMPWYAAVNFGSKNPLAVMMIGAENTQFASHNWKAVDAIDKKSTVDKKRTEINHARI